MFKKDFPCLSIYVLTQLLVCLYSNYSGAESKHELITLEFLF